MWTWLGDVKRHQQPSGSTERDIASGPSRCIYIEIQRGFSTIFTPMGQSDPEAIPAFHNQGYLTYKGQLRGSRASARKQGQNLHVVGALYCRSNVYSNVKHQWNNIGTWQGSPCIDTTKRPRIAEKTWYFSTASARRANVSNSIDSRSGRTTKYMNLNRSSRVEDVSDKTAVSWSVGPSEGRKSLVQASKFAVWILKIIPSLDGKVM